MWGISVILKELPKLHKQLTNGRNFAQSGHPDPLANLSRTNVLVFMAFGAI
jgi:hypothetical protein